MCEEITRPLPDKNVEKIAAEIERLSKLPDINAEKVLDHLSEYVSNEYEAGASLFHASLSRQKGKRALSYGRTGETLIGIGEGNTVEIVHFPKKGPASVYLLAVSDNPGFTPHLKIEGPKTPQTCIRCHTENFSLIFGEYTNPKQKEYWTGSLGSNYQAITEPEPEHANLPVDEHRTKYAKWYAFNEMKEMNRFAPYFKSTPAVFGPVKTDFFPYAGFAEGVKNPTYRNLRFLPDFRLAIILAKRAAMNTWEKAKLYEESRLKKYHPLLVRLMIGCSASQKETDSLNQDFARLVPVADQNWDLPESPEFNRKDELQKLKVLQILGIDPWGIVVPRAIDPENKAEVLSAFNYGPLQWNAGDNNTPEDYLFTLAWNDLKNKEATLKEYQFTSTPYFQKPPAGKLEQVEFDFLKPIDELVQPTKRPKGDKFPAGLCGKLQTISEERLQAVPHNVAVPPNIH